MTEFGVGTYTRNVIRALGRLDHSNEYFLMGSPQKVAEIGPLPPNFQTIPLLDDGSTAKGYMHCRAVLKRLHCDLVHIPYLFWMPRSLPCPYVMTVHDVLEHMYDPVVSVTQCARLLKPGGVLVVKSPNGPMQLRKERVRKMLGRGDGYVATIGHLNQFSPKTLSLAFRKSGLEPTLIRPARSFQEGITGPGFTARRVARHVAVAAANALMQATGVGLNLVGIARKPSAAVRCGS